MAKEPAHGRKVNPRHYKPACEGMPEVVETEVPPSAPIENKKVSHVFGWPFFSGDGDGTRTTPSRRADSEDEASG